MKIYLVGSSCGPAGFLMPLQMGNILLVQDVYRLAQTIVDYDTQVAEKRNQQSSNNDRFCAQMAERIGELFA